MKKTNRKADIEHRVNELLAQMNLEEKLAQLNAYWMFDLQTRGILDRHKVEAKLRNGIGQITRIGGASTYSPSEAAKVYNQIQHFLVEETRLGIPAINHEECCSGLMAPCSSIFPQMIGLASTFQPQLAQAMTDTIRLQMLATGARQGLAPVLDVARDPRWGRVEETFGEDPTLVSQFGVAYVRGLQGDDLNQGVMATAKHFVGHSFSQGGLNCGPVHIGWHDLWDTYLGPFEAAIKDAGLATVMNAYPEIDGELVASSRRIMTDLLRERLGFDGLVVSDYEAVLMIHTYHAVADNRKDAAIKSLTAGIDVELPTVACYGDDLLEAVKQGEVSEELVDLSVRRHLQKKFELGLFDNPYVNEDTVLEVFGSNANSALAYEIASKSLVLLTNNGVLPLKPDIKKLALIGPNADSARALMGDYSYAAVTELMRVMPGPDSSFETLTSEGLKALTVTVPTVLDVMEQRLGAGNLIYAPGCEISSWDENGFAEALDAAKASDVVVLVMGGKSGLAPDCTTGEFRDATYLGLPGVQEKLVKAIAATGKPVVLVLINGRPAAIPDLVMPVGAILEAWVPGQGGARAIVDALFGDVNPGGKLPISVPRSAGQVPVFYNHKPSGMKSNIYGDYFNEEVTPLFAFGHGLSYTRFDYQDLTVTPGLVSAGAMVDIAVKVTNIGELAGDEVVQLYVRDCYASLPRPVKELKGFARVRLEPGQSRTIVFHLPVNQMAYHDINFRLALEPGTFQVMVGSASDDIHLLGEFEVGGEEAVAIEERVYICPVEIL